MITSLAKLLELKPLSCLHDGNERLLGEVRFLPDLKHNLIVKVSIWPKFKRGGVN